jgi:uncharacterized protein
MLDVGHDAVSTAWFGRIAMSAPHRPLDRRSGLVLDTHQLGRRAGAMQVVQTTAQAPADLGIAVIGVPPGSPVELDLRLESVVEGVLVSGTATVELRGECVRCLDEVSAELEIDVQELFVYPGSEATEEEASRLEGDLVDLEPLLRDGVVLDLPFQPLCREDCQGLCVVCGVNLNADPDHSHEAAVDPRWEKLRRLEGDDGGSYDVVSKSQA